jgi:hypothetical protein
MPPAATWPAEVVVAGRMVRADARFHQDNMPGPQPCTGGVIAALMIVPTDGDTTWRPPVRIDSVLYVVQDTLWAARSIAIMPWGRDTAAVPSRAIIPFIRPAEPHAPITVVAQLVLPDGRRVWLRSRPTAILYTM